MIKTKKTSRENYKKIIYLLFLFAFLQGITAQNRIKGKILDSKTKEPLPYANLYINDTVGTTTNEKGLYSLVCSDSNAQVTISYVGYLDLETTCGGLSVSPIIELEVDQNALDEVVVTAYGSNKLEREVTSGMTVLTKKNIQNTETTTLNNILETIPGVQVNSIEQYNTKISIRGSGNRSTTGSRNIKAYLNNIPLTQSTGMTWLGGIGPDVFDRIEVLKGPASGVYGMGTGGIIRFKTLLDDNDEISAESKYMTSAFGTSKWHTEFLKTDGDFKVKLTYQELKTEGYRAFSKNDSKLLFFHSSYLISPKESFDFQFLRTDQNSQNPGPLDYQQISENRKQSNNKFESTNSGRSQVFNRYGATYKKVFSNEMKLDFSLFGSHYDYYFRKPAFVLPGTFQEVGYRLTLGTKPVFEKLKSNFLIGTEYQNGKFRHVRFKNNNGIEGENNINTNERSIVQNYFLKSETELHKKIKLIIDLGINNVDYSQVNFLYPDQSNAKVFKTQFTPRAALSFAPKRTFTLHASLSKGFSPPSFQEARTLDGNLNQDLEPETGVNYEIKEIGSFLNGSLKHQISLFCYLGKNELVKQSLEGGEKYYLNAGKTRRMGVETSLGFMTDKMPIPYIEALSTSIHFHYFDFRFLQYNKVVNGIQQNYEGNDITGISPFHLHCFLGVQFSNGFYWDNSLVYNAKTPVNDESTIFNRSYHRYDATLGYEKNDFVIPRLQLKAFIRANNITNTSYNQYFDLNLKAGNEKYFYPAPNRHVSIGLSIRYGLL